MSDTQQPAAAAASHTPGPWTNRKQFANRWVIEHAEPGCLSLTIGHVCTTILEVGVANSALTEANARLIAASPELLKACERLVGIDWSKGSLAHDDALDKAHAAIAQAKGESQ